METSLSRLSELMKAYVPPTEATSPTSHDAGIEWSADVLANVVGMARDFLMAVVALGAFLVRSLYNAVVAR